MKGFFIKQLNTCFIVFNKSGSLLFINTFYKFSKLKNFDFENLTDSKFLELKQNNTKFVFIVRNPEERFLTCFWRWFLEKHFWGNIPEDNYLLEMQEFINSEFDYFVANYKEIIFDKRDYHLAPQRYQLLQSHFDRNIKINIESIENLYGKNYTFLKLENVHNLLKQVSQSRSPYEYIDDLKYDIGTDIEYFANWSTADLFLLSDLYFGTRIQLEKQHHHLNKNVVVNEINYKKLSNIVLDEMVVYGYRKSII